MKRIISWLLWGCLCFTWSASLAADNYTSATAIEQVRMLLQETTNNFFTDTELTNWIKEATEDVSTRTGCVQLSDTITLVTGQYEYTALVTAGADAVADIISVAGVMYAVTTDILGDTTKRFIGLRRIDPSQIADIKLIASGPPRYYYHYADKIGILPLPTATENSQVVRIYGAKQSQTIGDLPNQYQSLTFWYAAAQALEKRGNTEASAKMFTKYLQKLEQVAVGKGKWLDTENK